MKISINLDKTFSNNIELISKISLYNSLVDLNLVSENENIIPYNKGISIFNSTIEKNNDSDFVEYNQLYKNYIYNHPEISTHLNENVDIEKNIDNEKVMKIYTQYFEKLI